MSRAECATLTLGLALMFGALWGLGGVSGGGIEGLVIGNS